MGFLNHARIFLNTKVKNQGQFSWWSGSLQSVGNFFLAPTRFLFLGKTVRIYTPEGETEEAFAKVSSFFYNDRGDCGEGPSKISKQQPDQRLESQNWSWLEYTAAPLALVLAIPFGIVGAFCKLISYVDPSIYNAHHKVVSKLTAEDRIIDLNFMDDSLMQRLEQVLKSGQKIKSLTIKQHDTNKEIISRDLLKQICLINPETVILQGDWKKQDRLSFVYNQIPNDPQNPRLFIPTERIKWFGPLKYNKWDISALPDASSHEPSAAPIPRTVVASIEDAKKLPCYSRFKFNGVKKHTIIVADENRIKAALRTR